MGDENCNNIIKEYPDLSNYELNQLRNLWDGAKPAFDNLLGTIWTFDKLVYDNESDYTKLKEDYNYNRYNKLQILSDKVLISNLSTGFNNELSSGTSGCSPGFIQLKYAIRDNKTNFLEGTENVRDKFRIQLESDTEDTPNKPNLWLEVTVDPVKSEDEIYKKLDINNIRTSNTEPISGLYLKFEINFEIEDCGKGKVCSKVPKGKVEETCTESEGATNRLGTSDNKISYWSRMHKKNMCNIDNTKLSEQAVLAKCLKYKSGNYSDNIKKIYNNLIVTAAKSKNLIRDDTFNGDTCIHRDEDAKNICNNNDSEKIDYVNETCAKALNCEWDKTFQNSMGEDGEDASTCEGTGTKCLLNETSTTQNLIANIENSLELYYEYGPHKNPYNNTLSEFGEDCNSDILTKIENVCFDKNIGISFRFEPVSCIPGHPQENQKTCISSCKEDDSCMSPVLVSEPDLSAFKCTLEGLDQLENYCKKINDEIIENPNYYNLGFTKEQIQLTGYDENNYPYTGCNESSVESHLLYIRSLIMGKLEQINNNINKIIENDAKLTRDYSIGRNRRMEELRDNIKTTTNQILEENNNVLRTMEKIGTVNNDYNKVRGNIIDFNYNLDLRFDKKKIEFKVIVFFSILIVNILIILIFYRKK